MVSETPVAGREEAAFVITVDHLSGSQGNGWTGRAGRTASFKGCPPAQSFPGGSLLPHCPPKADTQGWRPDEKGSVSCSPSRDPNAGGSRLSAHCTAPHPEPQLLSPACRADSQTGHVPIHLTPSPGGHGLCRVQLSQVLLAQWRPSLQVQVVSVSEVPSLWTRSPRSEQRWQEGWGWGPLSSHARGICSSHVLLLFSETLFQGGMGIKLFNNPYNPDCNQSEQTRAIQKKKKKSNGCIVRNEPDYQPSSRAPLPQQPTHWDRSICAGDSVSLSSKCLGIRLFCSECILC